MLHLVALSLVKLKKKLTGRFRLKGEMIVIVGSLVRLVM